MSAYRARKPMLALAITAVLALPGAAPAAVGTDATDAPPRLFRVLPNEHPVIDPKRRLIDLRRPIIVKSEIANQHFRQGLYRSMAMIMLGLLGLAWVGYRAYGRRQASAVR